MSYKLCLAFSMCLIINEASPYPVQCEETDTGICINDAIKTFEPAGSLTAGTITGTINNADLAQYDLPKELSSETIIHVTEENIEKTQINEKAPTLSGEHKEEGEINNVTSIIQEIKNITRVIVEGKKDQSDRTKRTGNHGKSPCCSRVEPAEHAERNPASGGNRENPECCGIMEQATANGKRNIETLTEDDLNSPCCGKLVKENSQKLASCCGLTPEHSPVKRDVGADCCGKFKEDQDKNGRKMKRDTQAKGISCCGLEKPIGQFNKDDAQAPCCGIATNNEKEKRQNENEPCCGTVEPEGHPCCGRFEKKAESEGSPCCGKRETEESEQDETPIESPSLDQKYLLLDEDKEESFGEEEKSQCCGVEVNIEHPIDTGDIEYHMHHENEGGERDDLVEPCCG